MQRLIYSTIMAVMMICWVVISASNSHAALGDVLSTIPSPIPAGDSPLIGAAYADGMLIVAENGPHPSAAAKFHKIDPVDGTILATIDFPFTGWCAGLSFDGTNLWVIKYYSGFMIYEVGLDGSLISQFHADVGDYFDAFSINCEGDFLWLGCNGQYSWTKLVKMTKTGVLLESYSTTGIINWYMGGEIDIKYPTGSNLIVVDNSYDNGPPETLKRLSTEGGTVTVVDQGSVPTTAPNAYGLAFDGDYLWLNAGHPNQGVIWRLSDGQNLEAAYKIDQSENAGYNPWIKGQTFTPGIGIDPDPGTVTTIDLTGISFSRSSQGWSGPTSFFYLNIYDGDPVNGSGTFVGSSINTVDVAVLGDFNPMLWTFDRLTLDYNHEYWALVSSTSTAGGFDVYCGMRESSASNPYAGGTAIAGITSDHDGYHVKPTIDLAFEAGFDLYPLIADADTLSVSTGGSVHFSLRSGGENAGRYYLILGSLSGSTPGIPLPNGGETLPIHWDSFTDLVLAKLNTATFTDFLGLLDSEGQADAQINVSSVSTSKIGKVMTYAYCLEGLPDWDFVSNTVIIEFVP